jgi:hypothetical protein
VIYKAEIALLDKQAQPPLATSRMREFAVVDSRPHEADVARREIDRVPDRAPTGKIGHSLVTEIFASGAPFRLHAHAILRNEKLA